MGIDLHTDWELVPALDAFFLDELRQLADDGEEGLAGIHDMVGVGGDAVDAEGIVGFTDLVDLCAV